MGCFLDTTVVVKLTQNDDESKAIAGKLAGKQPVVTPHYALREMLAGVVQIICAAHNRLNKSPDIGKAFLGALNIHKFAGRSREGQLRHIAEALAKFAEKSEGASLTEAKRAMMHHLAVKAQRQWARAIRPKSYVNTQPLACFSVGSLEYDSSGELLGFDGRFGCDPTVRCAAASYLFEKQSELNQVVKVLHPSKLKDLNVNLVGKTEISQRRKALKELLKAGPTGFNKRYCRALGDAYFAVMCPAGHHVTTTNTADFEPMCGALNKEMIAM